MKLGCKGSASDGDCQWGRLGCVVRRPLWLRLCFEGGEGREGDGGRCAGGRGAGRQVQRAGMTRLLARGCGDGPVGRGDGG